MKNNQKKRLVIDYSETINRYTFPTAYPLPRIADIVQNLAKYRFFSRIDLKSAYHQVPIAKEDQYFTAFEADGALYEFTRIPFGVTNGVACFQECLNNIIKERKLLDTFAYLDDVTICGASKSEHDRNLENFLKVAGELNLTINEEKSKFCSTQVAILGHLVEYDSIKPDPDRLKPLLDLEPPTDGKTMKRVMGFFSHYSKWVQNFSKKIQVLVQSSFPMNDSALKVFQGLKEEIAEASLGAIDNDGPFVVETDASDFALAATLSQHGRPVAFFARSLNGSERAHSSVEKEARAIVDSLKYWRHFLIGKKCTVITDQKSVSFIFASDCKSKIKNEKLMRWKLELSSFVYDIQYRPGEFNCGDDALSRDSNLEVSASVSQFSLKDIHDSLGHPGISRLLHFIRSKNLPFSTSEVRNVTQSCSTCAKIKPQFLKYEGNLINSTRPLQRLSLDFKGPLPSRSRNKYLLTIIDEFSRFPFAFSVNEMTTEVVIKCLCSLFCLVGMPESIHSDRGKAFVSAQFKQFLYERGIALTHSSPYNPRGNSQIERLNGTIWRTIELTLKGRGLETKGWEQVLPDSLHSIRSLLCTSTNKTPHERFYAFSRKSSFGTSMPSWLMSPGNVLLRRHVRASKYEPHVDEVELIDANPDYATIRHPSGRESNVSLRDLAPLPSCDGKANGFTPPREAFPVSPPEDSSMDLPSSNEAEPEKNSEDSHVRERSEGPSLESHEQERLPLRRSQRNRRPPVRYGQ